MIYLVFAAFGLLVVCLTVLLIVTASASDARKQMLELIVGPRSYLLHNVLLLKLVDAGINASVVEAVVNFRWRCDLTSAELAEQLRRAKEVVANEERCRSSQWGAKLHYFSGLLSGLHADVVSARLILASQLPVAARLIVIDAVSFEFFYSELHPFMHLANIRPGDELARRVEDLSPILGDNKAKLLLINSWAASQAKH